MKGNEVCANPGQALESWKSDPIPSYKSELDGSDSLRQVLFSLLVIALGPVR